MNEPDWNAYPELLRPKHVQQILGTTLDRTYSLFHATDTFPSIRLGKTALCIPKARFLTWLGYQTAEPSRRD
jgi:hypothetical protein